MSKELERFRNAVHPWYGPCDGFADGTCSVCKELISGKIEPNTVGWILLWLTDRVGLSELQLKRIFSFINTELNSNKEKKE